MLSWAFPVVLPSGKLHKTSLMLNQQWFGNWLGAVRHQAITWTNVDWGQWCHMASLNHNESIFPETIPYLSSYPGDYWEPHWKSMGLPKISKVPWQVYIQQAITRTTGTPAFWWYPPPPHDYQYYWVILDPKSKEDKVKVTNLKNSPKFHFFLILKHALHTTHLLKLLDKMCKYEMDLTSIVEDTEWTIFCPQTDRRTRWNQYILLSTCSTSQVFVEARGIISRHGIVTYLRPI